MQFILLTLVFLLAPPPGTPPATFSIPADAALVKLQRSLPAGWSMKIAGDQLVIESSAEVWVLFENRINAPDNQETEAQLQARILKYGKKTTSSIVLRLEKKWTRVRLDAARAHNREILKKTAELVVKHGLGPVFSGNSKLTSGAVAEQKGLGPAYRSYIKERKILEAGLIALPEYESTLCSLWVVATRGATDAYSLIHPDKISVQNYSIRNQLKVALAEVR